MLLIYNLKQSHTMYQGLVSIFCKGQMVTVIDVVGHIILLIQTNFVFLQF